MRPWSTWRQKDLLLDADKSSTSTVAQQVPKIPTHVAHSSEAPPMDLQTSPIDRQQEQEIDRPDV